MCCQMLLMLDSTTAQQHGHTGHLSSSDKVLGTLQIPEINVRLSAPMERGSHQQESKPLTKSQRHGPKADPGFWPAVDPMVRLTKNARTISTGSQIHSSRVGMLRRERLVWCNLHEVTACVPTKWVRLVTPVLPMRA